MATMRDPARIPRICKKLEKVWKKHPDQRLGQLVSNLMGPGRRDVFFTEDTDWETLINEALK
jgi:hypothetical protein